MKIHEVRALSTEDLIEELEKTHRESLNVRFGLATRQLSDTSQQGKIREKIARIKTVLRERELMEQQA